MQGLRALITALTRDGSDSPLDMGPTEFKLLHFFMTHPERVYNRERFSIMSGSTNGVR